MTSVGRLFEKIKRIVYDVTASPNFMPCFFTVVFGVAILFNFDEIRRKVLVQHRNCLTASDVRDFLQKNEIQNTPTPVSGVVRIKGGTGPYPDNSSHFAKSPYDYEPYVAPEHWVRPAKSK